MSEWLGENTSRPSHHLVRFMAHLALTLRSLGLQTREEICVAVIEAYVKVGQDHLPCHIFSEQYPRNYLYADEAFR